MSPYTLYPYFNFGVLVPWALLVFAPRWKWTWRVVHGASIVIVLSAAHLVLFGIGLTEKWIPEGAGGGNLHAAMRMFESPWLALTCWIHYLAFDLFVGAWIARDGQRQSLPHVLVAICLVVTCFLGPPGLVVYLAARFALRKRLAFTSDAPT